MYLKNKYSRICLFSIKLLPIILIKRQFDLDLLFNSQPHNATGSFIWFQLVFIAQVCGLQYASTNIIVVVRAEHCNYSSVLKHCCFCRIGLHLEIKHLFTLRKHNLAFICLVLLLKIQRLLWGKIFFFIRVSYGMLYTW